MLDTTTAWVADGGLETDLIFSRGVDLPQFAAFPLVDDVAGRELLRDYYRDYAQVAADAGAGLLLETPTWRANPDWAARVGYDAAGTARVNADAVALLRELAGAGERVALSGVVGPRGDGYAAGAADPDEAAEYATPQVRALAGAGVDVVHGLTFGSVAEAVGLVRAARSAGVGVGVSFTVETDGRLADGTGLRAAVEQTDAAAAADWYGVNCAHPRHLLPALDGGAWQARLAAFRPNASAQSHEELDAADVLDRGDLDGLVRGTGEVVAALPGLAVLGGCCGTDVEHVAAIWTTLGDRLRTA